MNILQANNIKKCFSNGKQLITVLDDLNLTVQKGEFISIMGRSGSGKTTLLNMIGGLDYPTEGNIIIEDKVINEYNDEELSLYRRRNIGFIFQYYNLIPVLNVEENIKLTIEIDNGKVDENYFQEISTILGLENKLKAMPTVLSGGEKQRVAIARALVSKPKLIIADEPTGNLDYKTGEEVIALLQKAVSKFQQTLILVTHDSSIAEKADRTLVLKDGKLWKQECSNE